MQRAIGETNRQRAIQQKYNEDHGITPQTVIKAVRELIGADYVAEERASYAVGATAKAAAQMGIDQVVSVIGDLEKQMTGAAKARDSECAAIPDSLHAGLHLLIMTAPAIRDGWAGHPRGLITCSRE